MRENRTLNHATYRIHFFDRIHLYILQNVYDEAPVEDILPETMEAFLDEFCLTSQGDLTNKDFKVSLSALLMFY